MNNYTIALVGNPNCGKTTLFNALTGSNQTVGNWSGVTVEKKTGQLQLEKHAISVVDLPGTYTLEISKNETAIDEKIATQFILDNSADLIINIVDASKLERHLFLTTQLLDIQVPVILAVNMIDVANKEGTDIDCYQLSQQLQCPVIPIVAAKQVGIQQLKHRILKSLTETKNKQKVPEYSEVVEAGVQRYLEKETVHNRWQAIQELLRANEANEQQAHWDVEIANTRFQFAQQLVEKVCSNNGNVSQTLTDKIDNIVINRFLGIPIFLSVMYLLFLFSINIGSAFIDFFDIFFAAIFVNGLGNVLTSIGLHPWIVTFIADGIGGGIQLVATFIPVIGSLYLFLSIIEDSGYMARAAFVMDRLMRAVGLPGKSFVPLVVGFGCNVPAVMATRTMETQKDRMLTIAMTPFMSCGARLSVYALFTAAFFTENGQNVVFALYFLGVTMAMLTALFLKFTILSPQLTPFIMELPTYHVPTAKAILLKTWHRLQSFVTRAGKTIVIVFIIIKLLSTFGADGSLGNDDSDKSLLSVIGKTITPIFTPMGVEKENWPATVGIFTGVFAKEVVVGSLDALYSSMEGVDNGAETELTVLEQMGVAWSTIPVNLASVADNLLDPIGLSITQSENQEAAAEAQAVNISTFRAMVGLFGSDVAAFSYLVFILLYTPCVATMGAILRESGMKWMLFVAVWATGVAYLTATNIYQIATFSAHPVFSGIWCAVSFSIIVAAFFIMRYYGRQMKQQDSLQIPIVNIN